MDETALRTYLDEHLVGARTVTALVERRLDDGIGPAFLTTFRAELVEERALVEGIAERLDASGAVPARLAATVAQAGVRGALRVTEAVHDALRDLLEFEAMLVGVHGKAALWRSLRLWPDHPALAGIDLDRLETQAEDQARQLEEVRIEAARDLGRDG